MPRADAKFKISGGKIYDQKHGKLDDDIARPPPERHKGGGDGVRMPTVYPSPMQADEVAGLLRTRVRLCASIGTDERIFEGMLERRGISMLNVDWDTFSEGEHYFERRIYCSEVRRVAVGCLMKLPNPSISALVFVNGHRCPWEAYLAHYPDVPLILVIGDDASTKRHHHPKPAQLEAVTGLKLLRRMPIDCYEAPPLTLAVYERRA